MERHLWEQSRQSVTVQLHLAHLSTKKIWSHFVTPTPGGHTCPLLSRPESIGCVIFFFCLSTADAFLPPKEFRLNKRSTTEITGHSTGAPTATWNRHTPGALLANISSFFIFFSRWHFLVGFSLMARCPVKWPTSSTFQVKINSISVQC